VFDDDIRRGMAVHSLVGEGCILSGGQVKDSILGRNVFVHSWSLVTDSILLDGVEIGRHARIRKCIIDKNVRIPPGTVIGFNPDDDRARFHVDPDSGVVVIPKVTGPEQKTSHHQDG
jgi:glucose-1-phosphate adenylyltransferase